MRGAARAGMHRILRQAYIGDQHERAWSEFTSRNLFDRLVQRMLKVNDLDGLEPWWMLRRRQVAARRVAILATFVLAASASAAAAFDHPAAAIPLLLAAASLDIAEGAFARSVHMRDAGLRWTSCIASHGADVLLMGGVAVAAARHHHDLWGGAVLAAMLATLFGSFVRVSAMQAGYRFWRLRSERFVRHSAFLAYLATSMAGRPVLGIVVLTCACSTFGLLEVCRVVRAVARMPAVHGAGVVFVDSDDVLHSWPLADDSPGEMWSAGEDDAANSAKRVAHLAG